MKLLSNIKKNKEKKLEKKLEKQAKKAQEAATAQFSGPILSPSMNLSGTMAPEVSNMGPQVGFQANRVRVKAGAHTVVGTRSYQQDAYRLNVADDNSRIIAVLCDGMGGLEGGEKASNMVADYVLSQLLQRDADGNYMDGIKGIILKSNELVHGLRNADGNPMHAGTTLVIAVIYDGKLNLISVGDSCIYYYEAASGLMKRLTNDHNYTYMAEQLKNDSSFVFDPHQRGDALVSFIGAPEIRYVDTTPEPIEVHSGDKILMCTDGLYKLLDDETIRSILAANATSQQIAEEEITRATQNVTRDQDNTTVVVLEIE